MDRRNAKKAPRARGRPLKVKQGVHNLVSQLVFEKAPSSSSNDAAMSMPDAALELALGASQEASRGPRASSSLSQDEIDDICPTGSKRSLSAGDERDAPSKRIRATHSESNPRTGAESDSPQEIAVSSTAADRKATVLPARRSTRHTTVQATQISEGTLRPPGPPCLEAALRIALRNLESEMWRYLWIYYKRHRGDPLPTPAMVKAACPRVRRAAEAVDKADRELEDAIDEIIRSNSRKKRRGAEEVDKTLETTPSAKEHPDVGTDILEPVSLKEHDSQSEADNESADRAAIVVSGTAPKAASRTSRRNIGPAKPAHAKVPRRSQRTNRA